MAGVAVALVASVAAVLLILRGLWAAQPLVTFAVPPTRDDAARGRWKLSIAAALTVVAGGALAAGGAEWRGLALSLVGPVTSLLGSRTPARRGFGWAGLLLALAGVGLVVHRGVELA